MEKIKNNIINKKLIEKLIFIFLIIQPLLDFHFLFQENIVNFFGFSPSTIIRMGFMGVIGVLFLLILRNKKEIRLYIGYIILILLYVILHHWNAAHFTDYYGGYDFGYTLMSEIFYIIRMLLPLALLIISSHYTFEDNKIEKMVQVLILLICGSIIITNLFEISLGSYSKVSIEGNIFCWFKNNRCNLNYYSLASKGFFNDPNRLSALLTLLTPLVYYIFIRNNNKRNVLLVFITMFGMFMLGTKVSTYGFLILSILSFICYIFFTFIKKELKHQKKTSILFISVILISLIMVPFSPALNRTQTEEATIKKYNSDKNEKRVNNQNNLNKLEEELKKAEDKDKEKILKDFIKENYEEFSINPQFIIDSYSYKLDPEFWYNIMKMPLEERTNFRLIEELMLKRVKEKNNNSYDDLFGITFTRMGNIFDLERDFISHYYTLGIIGLILLLVPYIVIVIVCIIKILLNVKEKLNVKNVFYLMGVGISLCAAFYSGNVMDGLIVTLILGFIMGQLINSVFQIGNTFQGEKNEN